VLFRSNSVATSPDGITWTTRTTPATGNWYSVAYGKGLYVAVHDGGGVMTSSDAITWTTGSAPAQSWTSVAYGNGRFVATAYGGANRVMTSTNGINWTLETPPTVTDWGARVMYANDQFLAVGSTGGIMRGTCGGDSCFNPAGAAGEMAYNDTRRVLQWCDGTSWHAAGPDNIGGPTGGCSNPAGTAGAVIYNADFRVAQYCDGGTWRSVGAVCESYNCGLVHHWKLDETTLTNGSPILDSAGNAHGTVVGTLTSAAGKNGTGIVIDANNEYVNTSILSALSGKTQFTLSAWLKRTAAGSIVFVGSHDNVAANNPGPAYVDLWNDNSAYWGIGNDSTGSFDEAAFAGSGTNWYHVAVVYDGTQTGNNNRLRSYLNGAPVSPAFTGTIPAISSSAALPFRMGQSNASIYSRGTIDDVRIYNRPLSASDVAALYAATSDPCIVASPPIGAVCTDGSVYAGLSPDGNKKMYISTAAVLANVTWGSSGTARGTTSSVTGLANTNTLAAFGAVAHPAAHGCWDLTANGKSDWYLPAGGEQNVLLASHAALNSVWGATGWAWSSTEANATQAYERNFGTQGTDPAANKVDSDVLVCVRRDP